MIPKGWSSQKLSSVASIIDCKHRTPEYVKSGIPLVSPGTIKWGALDLISPVKRVTEEEYRSLMDHCVVEQGDLVMSRNQSVGVVSYVDSKKPFVLGQDTVLIKAIHADWRFIYYTLQSDLVQRQIAKSAGGSTFSRINLSDIRALNIKTPAICEQDKISQILTAWDKAISVTEKLLTNSQQQKKALMQQLLTGKKRLLDENGVRFSGEWEVVRLKQLIHEEKKRNRDNHIQRVLSVTNHSGFVLPEEQFSKRVASEDVSTYKIVKKNQYGYNPSRLNVGSFARLDNYDEGVLSPMYVVFSINHERLNSDYFLNWMSSNEAKQRIAGSTQGSVRDSVGFDALCSFSFSLPTLMEQQKIAAVLSAADAEMSMLEKKLACLKEEKKALMQQLLTGKRRVNVESEETVSA